MAQLGPEFIDITWNAGGITSDLTIEVDYFINLFKLTKL